MEVKATPTLEDDQIKTLYEASLNGCVSTLKALIQMNPLILNRVSLSPFSENPLHVASLLGHLEFCEMLLKIKPSLANEADSEGRFPLHLASAEGHTEVVKALLVTNSDVCFAMDKDERIPLHLAAMRGRIGAIQELTRAKPDSIHQVVEDGSVLHLCVRYNHLEALKFFAQSATSQFLLAKDKEGNTLLHLAVRLKQIKTIKYLLTLPEMRTASNPLNEALEGLERCPRDFISLKIQDMLHGEAGVHSSSSHQQGSPSSVSPPHETKRRKLWKTLWFNYMQYQNNWIEEKRGSLMVVATVIATITFQSAITPPGGVWQQDTKPGALNCTTYGVCKAGTAVLAYDWPSGFLKFMTFNTTSFFSSLCVVVLLISGLRLDNKPIMWTLIIALFSALNFLGHTYFLAQRLVTPDHVVHKVRRLYVLSAVWVIIPGVVVLFHVIHLVIFWVNERKKKLLHRSKRLSVL